MCHVNLPAKVETMTGLVNDWNAGLDVATQAVMDHNEGVSQQAHAGTMSAEQATRDAQVPFCFSQLYSILSIPSKGLP